MALSETPGPLPALLAQPARRTTLLSILGPMTLHHDGRELPLGPPRQRALLALLLLRLGRIVPTDLLVEELWASRPPSRPVASLQSHVSRLRHALCSTAGPGRPPVLRYRAPGYVLDLDPELIDFCRFERLAADGRRLLDQGDPHAADDRLDAALALWHGSPYAEFDRCPPLYDESARLEQVRLTAVEARAEARLAIGAVEEVAADLEAEARRNPARERLAGHLMTALSRLGRQAEALVVYERTRSHLAETFGAETAVDLRRIRTGILRQEAEPAAGLAAEPAVGPAAEHSARPSLPATRAAAHDAAVHSVTAVDPAAAPAHPDPGPPAGPSPFTGRGDELQRLTSMAAGTLLGHGHLAAVLGPVGVGKTRLLLELSARSAEGGTGPEVVWSHCFPHEGVPPYWLWTQVLRRVSVTRPDALLRAAEPYGSLLAPLMPGPPAPPGPAAGADWKQVRFLRHDAVCEILLTLAAESPLVLFLEDLHWADPASRELLRLLASRRQGHPLGIVLTARELEADSEPELRRLLAEVLRGPHTETLRLGGLSRRSVATLVTAKAGPGVDPEVVQVLHQRSQGNPYFIMQLLSLFGDARALHRSDAVDVLLARVPTGVREALGQRFAALPGPTLRVLQLCAVIGAEIDTDLLQRTATQDEPVSSALETAISTGLLAGDPHHPGLVHFAHSLVRETLIAELPSEERHRLHARVAEMLCARRRGGVADQEIERVAHHSWHAGSMIPAGQALPWLLRAAERAEQHWAYDEVETWVRRAVQLVGTLPRDSPVVARLEQQLHIQLGQVLATTRGYAHPEAELELTHGRALNATTHTPEDPSVLWALCAAYLVSGRYDASRRFSGLLREIAGRTGEPVALLGAAYGEGIVLHTRGRLPQALVELEHGVEMADHFARQGHSLARTFQHDPRVSCRSYNAFTHWLLGDRETARTRRRELLRLTDFESRPSDRCFALYVDAVTAAWESDAATARTRGAEGARLADEHGLRYWKAMLSTLEGWGLTYAGEPDEGLRLMDAALAELRDCEAYLRYPLHLGLLGQAQHRAGRTEAARSTFHTLLAAVDHRRDRVYLHPALPATRLLNRLLGRSAVMDAMAARHSASARPRA